MKPQFQAACEEFAKYADMDGPHVPADPMSALQIRLARWEIRNFGWQSVERMALGVAEETGELCEALLSPNREDVLDAIADIFVYSNQIATHMRADYSTLMSWHAQRHLVNRSNETTTLLLVARMGRLCHAILKAGQGIRGFDDREKTREAVLAAMAEILIYSWQLALHLGADYVALVTEVAERVMKREWAKNKASADKVANGIDRIPMPVRDRVALVLPIVHAQGPFKEPGAKFCAVCQRLIGASEQFYLSPAGDYVAHVVCQP